MSDMPASSVNEQSTARRNRGRVVLLLILLVFLSPWIFAMLWKSSGRINHGELIEPPRPLPEITLLAAPGASASVEDFRGKWTWVVVVDKQCNDDCVTRLDLLRQVRIAQKKHVKRLRYSLVVVEPGDIEARPVLSAEVMSDHPELMIRFLQRDSHAAFLEQFGGENAGEIVGATIYVVDPLGNVMMKYPADSDRSGAADAEDAPELQPKHLHRDMARLLKASHVG